MINCQNGPEVDAMLLKVCAYCVSVGTFEAHSSTTIPTAHNDAADDKANTQQNVANGRDPECIPVQRRVTVGCVSRRRCELAECRIDPHTACMYPLTFC